MKYGRLLVCGIAAGAFAFGALAQDQQNQQPQRTPGQRGPGGGPGGGPREGGGGPGGGMGRQLSPDRAKAAWTAQANGVAARVGLNADQTKAAVAAYIAARESQGAAADKMRDEAMQKAREEGAGPETMRNMMNQVEELNTAEREKLQAALKTAIGADATAKVMPSFGLFSRQWDSVVDVFSTFKLEGANQQTGLNAIEDFAVTNAAAQAKARAARAANQGGGEGGAPPDREAMRAAAQEGRQKFLDAMKPILNKEQMTKLEESLPGGGRGGQGGGGGGRRQGGS